MQTDVLITGAGPTGLALACQLIRYGIDFVIVDRNASTTAHSKAIGVQARTLEIYEQIGLAAKLVDIGAVAEKARMIVGGTVRGEVNFAEIGKGLSPYPYVLIAEQGKHERLLHEFITGSGKAVRWNTALQSFEQDEAGVRATITDSSGETETITAKFLVGCDGAKSLVRRSLGLEFGGSTFERIFYVADVEIDWKYSHDALQVCLMEDQLLAFFPMTGDKQWRIVGTFPEEFSKDEGDILYEEIEEQIRRDSELELDITHVNWFSTYKVHTRHVNKFSVGRCFLAGDSAHIHTPAGAQGMNTGIQDGYNLAWKLALVLRGKASLELLNTYNEERLPNAENLTRTTDRFFELVASPRPMLSFVRMHIFPYVAGAAFRLNAVKRFVFPRISQIAINYRNSSLSVNQSDLSVKAGDRMPYFQIEGASIYDRLREPKFHVLLFSDGSDTADGELSDLSDLIDVHSFPLYPNVVEIFGSQTSFAIVLRPDNYIGLVGNGISIEAIRGYLDRALK